VQGVAVAAVFVGSVWIYGLLSLQLHRIILILNLTLLAVMTVVVALLAALDGAMGAAIGTASVEIASAITGALVLAHRRPHLRPDLRLLPKVALSALVGGAPMLLDGLPTAGRLVLSSGLYFALLLLLGAVPRELGGLLPRLRRVG
jgi:Na+-driven multidrug efflux pump